MSYQGCGLAKSAVGVAIFNGDLTLSQTVAVGADSASIDQKLKGKVLVQGAYDDFLEADVTQKINVGDLGVNGTGVSMLLKGTIATSEGSFVFDEMVNVMAGTITAKVTTKP